MIRKDKKHLKMVPQKHKSELPKDIDVVEFLKAKKQIGKQTDWKVLRRRHKIETKVEFIAEFECDMFFCSYQVLLLRRKMKGLGHLLGDQKIVCPIYLINSIKDLQFFLHSAILNL
jgi:hypothetical protein